MAKNRTKTGILAVVPGARAALRWLGWAGIALLVVPAVALAVLVVVGCGSPDNAGLWVLAVAAGLALVAAAVIFAMALARIHRLGELAQVLCDNSRGPVFVKDAVHRYRFVNEEAAALFARRPADVVGVRESELQPGAEALAREENDRVCLERDLPTSFRETQTTAEGGKRVFAVSKRPLHDTRGRIVGLVGASRDITDELELQKLFRQRPEEQRAWFDTNPLPMVTFAKADLRILKVNVAAEQCYGYSRAQFQQMLLSDLFAPSELDRLNTYLRDVGRAVPPGSVAWQHRRAGGELFDVLTDIGNLPQDDPPTCVMMVRDISAENALRQALRECAARYDDLLESGFGIVWMHDMDGRLLRANNTMANALGYDDREALVGRPLGDFVAEEATREWQEYMNRVRGLRRDAGLLHVATRGGERRVWQYQFVCYPDAEPAPYLLGVAQDVTVRHRYELRMRDQKQRDPLTGCHTRRYLEAFSWQASHDQVWGCVVVDIDYFRQVNASEGHERGDQMLRELAALLNHSAGTSDVVVRLGGDEFAIVMPHATENLVREVAERLAAVSRDGMPAPFSLGWAIREAGEPVESTLRRADKMLLRTRRRERGRA